MTGIFGEVGELCIRNGRPTGILLDSLTYFVFPLRVCLIFVTVNRSSLGPVTATATVFTFSAILATAF